MPRRGHKAKVQKTVNKAGVTPEASLWLDASAALITFPKLDNWVRVVLFNWILNRVHLRHPGAAPWNSKNWYVETDPVKLRERKSVPPELALECARVAKLKDIDRFRAGLTLELDREWRHHWSSDTAPNQKERKVYSLQQLKKLARLSSDLSDALGRLSYHAKVELSCALDEETNCRTDNTSLPPQTETLKKSADANSDIEIDVDTIELLMKHIDCVRVPFVDEPGTTFEICASAIGLVASAAAAAAAHAERVKDERRRRSRGRPDTGGGWATAGAGHFKTFALRILLDVRASGGYLTLNKNDDEAPGTLIQLLNRLRPYVPSGLIPAKTLPLSTLNRVKVLDQKIAATAKSTVII